MGQLGGSHKIMVAKPVYWHGYSLLAFEGNCYYEMHTLLAHGCSGCPLGRHCPACLTDSEACVAEVHATSVLWGTVHARPHGAYTILW